MSETVRGKIRRIFAIPLASVHRDKTAENGTQSAGGGKLHSQLLTFCVFVHMNVYMCAQAFAHVYVSVWLCVCGCGCVCVITDTGLLCKHCAAARPLIADIYFLFQ